MLRSYDVRTVALTVGADAKWVDNLLSHHRVPGCASERQGVQRQITDDGLLAIAIIRILNQELEIPLARATRLVTDGALSNGVVRTPSGIRVEVPVAILAQALRGQLLDALEAAPRVRRGRPPKDGG